MNPFTIVLDPTNGYAPFERGEPMPGWEPLQPRMMWPTAYISFDLAPALSRIMAKLMPGKPFAHWKEYGFTTSGPFLALSTVADLETARKLLEPIPERWSREWNHMTNEQLLALGFDVDSEAA